MAFTADDLRDELAEAAWRAQHPIRVEPGKLAQIATEGERVLLSRHSVLLAWRGAQPPDRGRG